jgi:WD40 repeat protein
MSPTTLTDLPPELLDHITTYIPSAQGISRLGATSKSLHAYIEKHGWQAFTKARFPSLQPNPPHDEDPRGPSYRDPARTLTTLSKCWDRRAFIARYTEPAGNVTSYPGVRNVQRWRRPRGQTIGYTPKMSVYEEIGARWNSRREILAFTAGAEICIRDKKTHRDGLENVRWKTYRPVSAYEGRDDFTTLHLIDPVYSGTRDSLALITGTANGDLWHVIIPESQKDDVHIRYFATQGLPVRDSSLLGGPGEQDLLAANLGDSTISLYPVHQDADKIAPWCTINVPPPTSTNGDRKRHHRVWSTQFLSEKHLAAGIGISDEPILIFSLTPSGIEQDPIRRFGLQNDNSAQSSIDLPQPGALASKHASSIYPIVPLPIANAFNAETYHDSNVFLSGAYDGIIRLHDLRSDRHVEQEYVDPTDDSSIYSLLPRGQEKLFAGSARHSLLKVFDLRLGSKCYSYLDAMNPSLQQQQQQQQQQPNKLTRKSKDWNLFLKSSRSGPGGGNHSWSLRRQHESSVYSLASPSTHSPYIYAGMENAVLELCFTSYTDGYPDPVFFSGPGGINMGWNHKEIIDLAMYDQTADMKLYTQRGLREMTDSGMRTRTPGKQPKSNGILDERWTLASNNG